MATREILDQVLDRLPADRVDAVLDFARFLACQEDHTSWRQFGMQQFARAYADDEPSYSEADLKQDSPQ